MFAEVADCLVPLGLWPEFEDVVNRGIVLSTASRHDLVLNMNILVIIYRMHEYLPKSYTNAIPEHFGDRLLRKFTELSSYHPLKSCPSSTTVSSSTSIVYMAASASIPVIDSTRSWSSPVFTRSQKPYFDVLRRWARFIYWRR